MFEPDPLQPALYSRPYSDLPGRSFDGVRLTRKDIWGRGAAQIFASVSKAMHDEFDIEYMIKTVGQCGLAYYGCCEPLDKKIDIVEKIPNLRKFPLRPGRMWIWLPKRSAENMFCLQNPILPQLQFPVLDKENLKKGNRQNPGCLQKKQLQLRYRPERYQLLL